MKQAFIILCILISFRVTGQIDPAEALRGLVTYETTEMPGTVNLTATGYGKTEKIRQAHAVYKAFHTLLFTGIPGSQYSLPLINDETRQNHPFIVSLLEKNYHPFILANEIVLPESRSKQKKSTSIVMRLTINCTALIKQLEKNKIIHPFSN